MHAIVKAALVGLLFAAPARADDAELHTFHCLHGCPMGASSTNDLIVREIYTLSSNDRTKFADWVAYRVTRDTVGRSLGRRWQADPWLGTVETLEPDDYDGAPQALRIDRGHQAPLAAFSGTPFAEDTNILSNITPQSAALNQAPWQYLEAQERDLVTRPLAEFPVEAVYVLTGPLYERVMPEMPMPGGAQAAPCTFGLLEGHRHDRWSDHRLHLRSGHAPVRELLRLTGVAGGGGDPR